MSLLLRPPRVSKVDLFILIAAYLAMQHRSNRLHTVPDGQIYQQRSASVSVSALSVAWGVQVVRAGVAKDVDTFGEPADCRDLL